jgi:hypothetical protein
MNCRRAGFLIASADLYQPPDEPRSLCMAKPAAGTQRSHCDLLLEFPKQPIANAYICDAAVLIDHCAAVLLCCDAAVLRCD